MNPFKWLFNKYIDWAFSGYQKSWLRSKRQVRIKKLRRNQLADTKRN